MNTTPTIIAGHVDAPAPTTTATYPSTWPADLVEAVEAGRMSWRRAATIANDAAYRAGLRDIGQAGRS